MTTEELLTDVLRREGWPKPASNHPADHGGWTRGGATALNWGNWRGLERPATEAELNAITEADLRAFYWAKYVRPYETVPDPLRAILVDWAITSWHDDPTKALQIALRRQGTYLGEIDGIFGPKTREALLQARDQEHMYRDVFKARIQFYVATAIRDPRIPSDIRAHTNLAFVLGWINRTLEFLP